MEMPLYNLKYFILTSILLLVFQQGSGQVTCDECGDNPPYSMCCTSIPIPLESTGDSATILYQWRICNGIWEMKISKIIIPEEAEYYIKNYEDVQALIISYLTLNNPMQFPPDSISQGEFKWRIIQPACWTISFSYLEHFNEVWEPCDSTKCCIKTFVAKISEECNTLVVHLSEEQNNGNCIPEEPGDNPLNCYPICYPFNINENSK